MGLSPQKKKNGSLDVILLDLENLREDISHLIAGPDSVDSFKTLDKMCKLFVEGIQKVIEERAPWVN